MVANTLDYVNPRETERQHLTPVSCGGYMVPLTGNFPRTDWSILMPPSGPLRIASLIDTNGDGVRDHNAESVLTFHDVDGDGVLEPGDALRIRTDRVTALPGVPFDFGADDVLAAARVVVVKLGGTPGDVVEPEEEEGERWDGQSRK